MTLCFVVPAHGRVEKAQVCYRQLRRTCNELADLGIAATAVVVADDENLETAQACGFETVEQANRPLGRKWNDGYEAAARLGADFFVPFGSDDWADPILFTDLPNPDEIRCCRLSSVVSENGERIAPLRIWYDGGDGVRILPRAFLEPMRFRPAMEGRSRAIDTSIVQHHQALNAGRLPNFRYFDASPYQLVDWKTTGDQLNTYMACVAFRYEAEQPTWATLQGRYPDAALDEMRAVYGLVPS